MVGKENIEKFNVDENNKRIDIYFKDEESIKKIYYISKKNFNINIVENNDIEDINNNEKNNKEINIPDAKYLYELGYNKLNDELTSINILNDSVNYISIQPNINKLNMERYTTDEFKENLYNKIYSRYVCKLPYKKMLDLILILIFAPNIYFKLNKEKKRYTEFFLENIYNIDNNNNSYYYYYYKFNYFFSNRDIMKINLIRKKINEILIEENIKNKEKYEIMVKELKDIFFKFINKKRIKMIVNEEWIDLKKRFDEYEKEKYKIFNYNNYENNNINENNNDNINEINNIDENNNINEINNNINENNNKINENNDDYEKNQIEIIENENKNIYKLKNDFLREIKPLIFNEDYRLCSEEGEEILYNQNLEYENLKNKINEDIIFKNNILNNKNGQFYCNLCGCYIFDYNDIEKTEFKNYKNMAMLQLRNNFFLKFKVIDNYENYNYNIENENFKYELKKLGFEDNLICCQSGKHILGFKLKDIVYFLLKFLLII